MIRATFRQAGERLCGLEITGHAGFAAYGQDIVCAAVTSALQLAVNGITEVLQVPAETQVEENRIALVLPRESGADAQAFLKALLLHLQLLAQDYENHIQVTVTMQGG